MSHIQPLLDEIDAGYLDDELHTLKAAIDQRQNARIFGHTIGDFGIGSRVVIGDSVRPKLLQGKHGTVTSVQGRGRVAVKLDTPIRRWVEPICPVSILRPAA